MARGVRERLGADVAVAVTGRRRPGRRDAGEAGRARLPARGDARSERCAIELDLPGDRETIRARATVAALHLVRTLLTQSRDETRRDGCC